jgi:hypothetical protein
MRRPSILALCAALLVVAGSSAAECQAENPTPALLDAAKASLAYLKPITVQIDHDKITLESGSEFRLTDGQAVLFWRPKGQTAWMEAKTGRFEKLEGPPGHQSFSVAFGELRAEITFRKFIDDRVWRFSGKLTNNGKGPVELARFHYWHGTVPAGLKFLELLGPREQPRLQSGRAKASPRADVEQFWGSMGVKWPRLAEPIHDQTGWFVSTDVAALVKKWNTPGWGFGFVGPGNAFGEIGYRGSSSGSQAFLGVLLDNIVLDPGATFTLEEALVWCGDWQSGMDVWARVAAAERGGRKPPSPLVGYCSWYQKTQAIMPEDIDRATREFAKWSVPPGGRTIQIDDGYQKGPGNWDPHDKFKAAWPGLAGRIAATGSVPGLWVAPTTVHESHPIVKEHPDWLQRLPSGEPAIAFRNWGGKTYYLEADHPEVRAFIRELFKRFCGEGWRYFKIDFAYPITSARVAYDRRKTEFQTQRDLFALIRESVGPNVLLNSCSGPVRYVLGQADIVRLGGDIGFNYGTMHETLGQSLAWSPTHNVWWQGDPDVFTMRSEGTQLSAEEKRLLTGTIGLFGGTFLTSDFATQWTADEAAFVRRFWNERGPRPPQRQYVVYDADGAVEAYRVSYDDGRGSAHRVALYNWTDAARDNRLRLSDAHVDGTARVELAADAIAAGVVLKEGLITVPKQPAHSLRIVDLVERKLP